jgi:hypothetical protein
MPARVFGILRRVGLEISAGQIVEQHFVVCAEEITPLVAQMSEEFFLERQHLIQRGVKLVDFGQAEILAEQVGQRGALEPVAMQLPLRAGREQPLGDEHAEDAIPARALARSGEMRGEEGIQAELGIEFEREPATAPLTGTVEGELIQPDLNHARVIGGRGAVMGKESDLRSCVGVRRMGVERFAPGFALGIVDLAEIEHLTLSDASVVETFVFDDTPVGVILAILLPNLRAEKHNDWREYRPGGGWEEGGSSLQANLRRRSVCSLGNPRAAPPKIVETRGESAK